MTSSKRSRSVDSDDEDAGSCGHVMKKQCSLPLRLSPSSSPRRCFAQRPQHTSLYTVPPTLTPVESSDEDVEDDERLAALSAFNISQPIMASSCRSSKAHASEADTMDVTGMPPPSQGALNKPPLARRRSNGISTTTPSLPMNFSSNTDQADANGGRIPTPIYGHFTSTDVNMDTAEATLNSFINPAAKYQLRHNHNALSPMMSEDGESEAEWWRRRQLPSPAESPITTGKMDRDDLSSPGMMDVLSIANIRTHNSEMSYGADSSPPLSSTSKGSRGHSIFERRSDTPPQTPRKGKLVMGFRAECDKCRKRVPGHYSHIVWE